MASLTSAPSSRRGSIRIDTDIDPDFMNEALMVPMPDPEFMADIAKEEQEQNEFYAGALNEEGIFKTYLENLQQAANIDITQLGKEETQLMGTPEQLSRMARIGVTEDATQILDAIRELPEEDNEEERVNEKFRKDSEGRENKFRNVENPIEEASEQFNVLIMQGIKKRQKKEERVYVPLFSEEIQEGE